MSDETLSVPMPPGLAVLIDPTSGQTLFSAHQVTEMLRSIASLHRKRPLSADELERIADALDVEILSTAVNFQDEQGEPQA